MCFKPLEALLIVKEEIECFDNQQMDNDSLIEKLCFPNNRIIDILSSYSDSTYLPEAMELLFCYLKKNQQSIDEVIDCIKNNYSINIDSYKMDYYTVNCVINALMNYTEETKDTKIFLEIANHYLNVVYTATEETRNNTITMFRIPLILTTGCKEYRKRIWQGLLDITKEAKCRDLIIKILEDYSIGWCDEVNKDVFEYDKSFIIPIIKLLCESNLLECCIIINNLVNKWNHYEIDDYDDINCILQCDLWIVYELFSESRWDGNITYDEFQEYRKQKISDYANDLLLEEIDDVVSIVNSFNIGIIKGNSYAIEEGVLIFAQTFFGDKERLLRFTNSYICRGQKLNVCPCLIIQELINLFGIDFTYDHIFSNDFPQKNEWQYYFFKLIPIEKISITWCDKFLSYLEEDNDRNIKNSSFRDIIFLDNYARFNPQIYCQAISIILNKEKYNPFMINIYLCLLLNYSYTKPEELAKKVMGNMEILRKMYFSVVKYDSNVDYDGKILWYFIHNDICWAEWYLEFFINSAQKHFRINSFWMLENYIQVIDLFVYQMIGKFPFSKREIIHRFKYLFSNDKANTLINERQKEWINHVIETEIYNIEFIKTLFYCISELSDQLRKIAVLKFIELNYDYDYFSQLTLESFNMSAFGSLVPHMQQRVQFYEELLPYFTGIKFLNHKKLILDKIEFWKRNIEDEELDEFLSKRSL